MEMQRDNSIWLAIDREILQLVDSGATMHIVPDYIANAFMAPVPLPVPVVPVIDVDTILYGANGPVELPQAVRMRGFLLSFLIQNQCCVPMLSLI